MRFSFSIVVLLLNFMMSAQTGWMPISNFGTNPGNLNMYCYTPAGISGSVALVVVMHGCGQNASTYAMESGWNKLADSHKFLVVYPEQTTNNNFNSCFNWFQSGDQDRGQGEALSIKQMVDYMRANHNIDSTKIFVTGLSAGACMTNVMLACYPDIFSKGAIMAGVPFKAATNSIVATNALYGFVTKTPQTWANLVTAQLPSFSGSYPKVAIFHGSSDLVVNSTNVIEIIKQWTSLHSTDQTADVITNSFNGNSLVTKNRYNNSVGDEVVQTYTINNMPHGIAIDTGSCYQKGGQTGTYAYEISSFHSSFWAAYFFNILVPSNTIVGLQNCAINQNGITYSVTNTASSYSWAVPSGASIITGQGTNQITVNFGVNSGNISVTETDANNCKIGPINLYVQVGILTNIKVIENDKNINFYPNPTHEHLNIHSKNKMTSVLVTNVVGETVFSRTAQDYSLSIDFTTFSDGTYFIYVKDEKGNRSIKQLIRE